jgi:hypothetical protein
MDCTFNPFHDSHNYLRPFSTAPFMLRDKTSDTTYAIDNVDSVLSEDLLDRSLIGHDFRSYLS